MLAGRSITKTNLEEQAHEDHGKPSFFATNCSETAIESPSRASGKSEVRSGGVAIGFATTDYSARFGLSWM